jgi:CheY-like chemotaxis protein
MKKVLIVEDEIAFSKILQSQLVKKDYLVSQATNGQEGLKKAKDENPDLIVLDIQMPVMDGITMLDLLRKEESGKHTKVIILSNIEPNDRITKKVIEDLPLYFFIKSDIKLVFLLKKIEKSLLN